MGRVALAIMRLPAPLGPVRLPRQLPDLDRRGGRPQEGRQLPGQAPHSRHPDQPVPGIAPGGNRGGNDRERQQGGGDEDTFHTERPSAFPRASGGALGGAPGEGWMPAGKRTV